METIQLNKSNGDPSKDEKPKIKADIVESGGTKREGVKKHASTIRKAVSTQTPYNVAERPRRRQRQIIFIPVGGTSKKLDDGAATDGDLKKKPNIIQNS